MKSVLSAILFCCSAAVADSDFYVGTWQSHKAKTLESMREVNDIPEEAVELFEGEFFGQLVNVVKKDSFATYFIDDKPKELVFTKVEVDILTPNKIKTKYIDRDTGLYNESILTYEGSCYAIPIEKWNFKEYFCKVE